MSETYRHIQLLGPELRNQIAAGEVVERPASAMKELLENSLDAHAQQIDVRLDNGGRDLIRVQDDGQGIMGAELELAVTRHATSKITSFDELCDIHTLGFRGEALPSIASVSRLRMASAYGGEAHELRVNYGVSEPLLPSSLPRGTLVEVRELFGNIPARLKFLKSPATELKRAQEVFERIALAHLDVGFALSSGERTLRHFLPGESLRSRLAALWPEQVVTAMRRFSWESQGLSLHGLFSPPEFTQLRANHLWFYVNGRPVQDKRLLAAVKEAYQGRLTSRDYPQIILFVEIDPQAVDVNVHPAKSEVRFQDEKHLFASCVRVLRQELEATTQVTLEASQSQMPLDSSRMSRPMGFWGRMDQSIEHMPIVERPQYQQDPLPWQDSAPPQPELSDPLATSAATLSEEPARPDTPASPELRAQAHTTQPLSLAPEQAFSGKLPHDVTYLGQIARTYLILRNSQDNMLIIDQHAAHERVLYERLLKKAYAAKGQLLIVPWQMGLHQAELSRLEEIRSQLTEMGFALEIDGQTLVMTAIPPILALAEARAFLRDALTGKSNDYSAMLKSMACKAAIKAGQTMTVDEVSALLEQWFACPDREFCPHGRPTVLTWDQAFLEKAFKRRT
ncbi:MAG: DNA mismatch repair endonuclease MutL [Desulfovibrio sp.]|nr:DNA mismatch repair endonuclease MutL [Desulfovibrio sp.]